MTGKKGTVGDEKLEEILERRRAEGMSQSHRSKDKSERMVCRRGEKQAKQLSGGRLGRDDQMEFQSQKPMDECWKRLAQKMEEEVLEKYKVVDSRRGAYSLSCDGGVYEKAESTERESGEKIVGRIFALFKESAASENMDDDSTEG